MLKKALLSLKERNDSFHDENQYLNLIQDILNEGIIENTRNGFTKAVFGSAMHFSLEDNKIPLMTTKKLAWKTCLKELLWFINGSTDNSKLVENNVKIWNDNATPEFKKSRGLFYEYDEDLGPIYGHQWRHFNAKYKDCKTDYTGKGVDQLQSIINSLSHPTEKFSRRLIMSAWNPCQIDEMALPPCHVLTQFNVNSKNELSCLLFQRSGDVGLGIPFNIASYAMLTHILARHCNLEPDKLIHFIGDAHIYENHVEPLKQQIIRPNYSMPTIQINKKNSINDYEFDDIKIKNYKYHPTIKMDMIA